jgi:hypothetical protein
VNANQNSKQLKLEKLRQGFERDRVAYQENAAHLRSLNQYLWQVPTIAITLTGGLWFGVTKIDFALAKVGLLAFAAVADLLLILVIFRVRHLFGQYLEAQKGFCTHREIKSESGPWGLPGRTVVSCFAILLLIASTGSIYAICKIDALMMPVGQGTKKSS